MVPLKRRAGNGGRPHEDLRTNKVAKESQLLSWWPWRVQPPPGIFSVPLSAHELYYSSSLYTGAISLLNSVQAAKWHCQSSAGPILKSRSWYRISRVENLIGLAWDSYLPWSVVLTRGIGPRSHGPLPGRQGLWDLSLWERVWVKQTDWMACLFSSSCSMKQNVISSSIGIK